MADFSCISQSAFLGFPPLVLLLVLLSPVLQRVLEADAIACTLPQGHDLGTRRDALLHLLNSSTMEVFGKVALLTSTHHPRQREGSAFVDHVDQPGHTPASHDVAIDDEPQRLEGERREPELDIGEK
jgi:hypothetical protein